MSVAVAQMMVLAGIQAAGAGGLIGATFESLLVGGGGASGTTNTIGRDGASGVLYVRVSGVSVDQATVDSQLSSASNMTTTVSAVGSDTLIEFRPTTATTVASVTWTPA